MTHKVCSRCGEEKSVQEFHPSRKGAGDGLHYYCKPCQREYQREWVEKNKEKVRASQLRRYHRDAQNPEVRAALRRKYRLRQYGLDDAGYQALLEEQGGGCAICQAPPVQERGMVEPRFHIDHCHDTGEVRGLLCGLCNRGLGQFGDDPERLLQAVSYLRGGQ